MVFDFKDDSLSRCLGFYTVLILFAFHPCRKQSVQSVDELKGFVNNRLMRASVITITDLPKTFVVKKKTKIMNEFWFFYYKHKNVLSLKIIL